MNGTEPMLFQFQNISRGSSVSSEAHPASYPMGTGGTFPG